MPPEEGERLPISEMSDRQIAEETLHLLRTFSDALQEFASNPMLRMIPGFSMPEIPKRK